MTTLDIIVFFHLMLPFLRLSFKKSRAHLALLGIFGRHRLVEIVGLDLLVHILEPVAQMCPQDVVAQVFAGFKHLQTRIASKGDVCCGLVCLLQVFMKLIFTCKTSRTF